MFSGIAVKNIFPLAGAFMASVFMLSACSGVKAPAFRKAKASDSRQEIVEEWPEGGRYAIPEKRFCRFAARLPELPDEDAAAAIAEVYAIADSLSRKYNDPWTLRNLSRMFSESFFMKDSPIYDEDIYRIVLKEESGCREFSGKERLRAEWLYNILSANNVGSEISDMALVSMDGKETTLHDLADGKRTLLFIYASSCSLCRKLCSDLRSSVAVREAVSSGRLSLVSVFAGDDMNVFQSMSGALGMHWQNYMDAEYAIYGRNVFDVRLIPSVYLVGADMIVEVKAADNLAEIESLL